jgi:aspartate aminotransferase
MRIADRVAAIAESATMAVDQRAKELRAAGRHIINFSAGEPDFPTPSHVLQAAQAAMERGETRYTAAGGTASLKAAVARRIAADTGLHYQPSEILVSVGGKHALFNAVQALVNPGDGVLVAVPYWVTYPEQIRFAGGVVQPVALSAADGWRLTARALEAAADARTRGMLLNSPANPTGAVIEPEELAAIARFAKARGLWVIADEIYGRLVYEGSRHQPMAALPGMRDCTVTIDGVSKAYAMTGWRIGYAYGPQPVIAAMTRLQAHTTSNPTSIAQAAAEAALDGPQEVVEAMRRTFGERRRYAWERVNRVEGFSAALPKGAFYLWVDVRPWLGRRLHGRVIADDQGMALALLEEAGVAVVPGSGFGLPGYLRLSYACALEEIAEGMDRLERLLGRRA